MKSIESEVFQEADSLKAMYMKGSLGKDELKEAQTKLATGLVRRLSAELAKVEFAETSWCATHQRRCPVSPRGDPRWRDALWLEGAGTTCCPWSRMSPGLHWLDAATLPCLAWAYACRFYEPDVIVHECVPDFAAGSLSKIMSEDGQQLKSVYARPVPLSALPHYEAHSEVISPVDLGIPAARPRRYTVLALSPFVRLPALSVRTAFFRTLELDARVFLVATAAQKGQEHQGMFERTGGCELDPGDDSAKLNILDVLGSGNLDRLEGYQVPIVV